MTISSRTPEGQPATCPLCGASVVVEPSVLFGDATCPNCGQLLWFLQIADQTRLFDPLQRSPNKGRLLEFLAQQWGVAREKIENNASFVNDLGLDSLDMVELVMEFEEEFP